MNRIVLDAEAGLAEVASAEAASAETETAPAVPACSCTAVLASSCSSHGPRPACNARCCWSDTGGCHSSPAEGRDEVREEERVEKR